MILLYRARLCLLAAVVAAALLVGLELPISELVHQQGQLDETSHQLAQVEHRNTALRLDVAALREDSAIAAIAHEEYGLVRPGQISYVILPSRGTSPATGALSGDAAIPAADLVVGAPGLGQPGSSGATGATGAKGASGAPPAPGLARRVVNRLEFWRWAF